MLAGTSVTPTMLKVLIGAVACLAGGLIITAYVRERSAHVAADAASAARQAQIDTLQKSVAQYQTDRDQIKAALDKQLDLIKQQNTKPWTPQQAVETVNMLPTLPIQAHIDPSTQNLVLPAVDMPALQAYKATCDETTAKFSACQLTAASFQNELSATKSEFTIMTADRDNWRTVAKGGTFWYRAVTASKHAGCGALGGGVAAKSDTNAAVYGGAAFGVCETSVWLIPKLFHHGKKGE